MAGLLSNVANDAGTASGAAVLDAATPDTSTNITPPAQGGGLLTTPTQIPDAPKDPAQDGANLLTSIAGTVNPANTLQQDSAGTPISAYDYFPKGSDNTKTDIGTPPPGMSTEPLYNSDGNIIAPSPAAQYSIANSADPKSAMANYMAMAGMQDAHGFEGGKSDVLPSGATANPGDGTNKGLLGLQTFVPGVGMIGPDLGGAVKGDMLRQQELRANNQDFRAESQLGLATRAQANQDDYVKIAQQKLGIDLSDLSMRQTKFGWQSQDRDRQQKIINGMAQAGAQGGYGAAIDFLKTVDPMMAVGLEAQKQKLDAGIMQNQVMQAQLPSQIQNGMLASYATLGKMYQGIMNAPADKQQQLYQTMRPMILKVNPHASEQWDSSSQADALLSTSQAMPQSTLWNTFQQQAYNNTQTGKINTALGWATKTFGSDSPQVASLQQEQQSTEAKLLQSTIDNTKAQSEVNKNNQQVATQQFNNTQTLNDNMTKANPGYIPFLQNMQMMQPLINTIKKDPNSPEALVAGNSLLVQYAKMHQDKRINPVLLDTGLTDNHLQGWYKQVESEIGSGKIAISPENLNGLVNVVGSIANSYQNSQLNVENQYKKTIPSFVIDTPNGKVAGIKEDGIVYPSQRLHDIMNSGNAPVSPVDMTGLSPQEQTAATQALQNKTMTPDQVQQKVIQIRQLRSASSGGKAMQGAPR